MTEKFFKGTYKAFLRGEYKAIENNDNGLTQTHLQIKEWEKYPNHYIIEVVCRNEYGSLYDTGVSYLVPKQGDPTFDTRLLIKL